MALVQFRSAAVRDYGLPQVCPCCGNDNDGELVLKPVAGVSREGWRVGCCLVAFFLGPVGWALGLIHAVINKDRKLPFPLPTCRLCSTASTGLWHRLLAIWIVTAAALGGLAAYTALPDEILFGLSMLVGLLALVEYLALSPQFRPRVFKANQETMLVDVPYEDYPAIYQRHLDNAVLYGSSEQFGTAEELT